MSRKRIGELLLERKVISKEQLESGLLAQKRTRQRLGITLIQQGVLTETQLAGALAVSLGLPAVDLSKVQVDWSAVHMLRARFCETHECFPFGIEGKGTPNKSLLLAMADPLNSSAIEEVEFSTGLKVSIRVATHSHVRGAILRYYHKVNEAQAAQVAPVRAPAVSPAPPPAPAPAARSTSVGAGGATVKLVPSDVREDPISGPVIIGEEVISGTHQAIARVPMTPAPAVPDPMLEKLISERMKSKGKKRGMSADVAKDLEFLFGDENDDEALEKLEKKFWVLMRIMARKGLITREEFFSELDSEE